MCLQLLFFSVEGRVVKYRNVFIITVWRQNVTGPYLQCTYDGDEDELMSAEVTHVVAEVESSIHSQVSITPIVI